MSYYVARLQALLTCSLVPQIVMKRNKVPLHRPDSLVLHLQPKQKVTSFCSKSILDDPPGSQKVHEETNITAGTQAQKDCEFQTWGANYAIELAKLQRTRGSCWHCFCLVVVSLLAKLLLVDSVPTVVICWVVMILLPVICSAGLLPVHADVSTLPPGENLEPTCIAKALEDPDWVDAMQEEMQQFINQQVWKLVPLPDGKHAIGTKWILKNKRDARGIVVRNKARLVAQGHRQEEGIDYDEVFAPVARIEAIRLFLAFASYMGFLVYQLDVKSAFLYGEIEEEVYVTQPKGFEDPYFPKHVYRVVKALYGLHQAPRAWYGRLSAFLLQHIPKSQDKYVKDMLTKFDMESVRTANTTSMIGSLMYLTASRPDIMFAGDPSTDNDIGIVDSGCSRSMTGNKEKLADFVPIKGGIVKFGGGDGRISGHKNPYSGQKGESENTLSCRKSTTDANEKNLIQVLKIHTDDNVADLLTKAFDGPRFAYLVVHIGMSILLLVVILPAASLVSAGSSMFLLVVILPAGSSRMASDALGHDQATVPSEDIEEREEEEVPLRRKRSVHRRARTEFNTSAFAQFPATLSAAVLFQAAVSASAGPPVGADKGKAPMPDLEIPAEFLAECRIPRSFHGLSTRSMAQEIKH
ncbi:putative ribonuclease H-like domain-containing protein [Tanacetum coccineum]